MKRILIAVLLVLVASQLMAADVLETWDDYRVAMRRKLGYDTAATGLLTDANAAAFIREAVVQIVPLVQARKQITSVVTTYKNYTYALDTTLTGILAVWWSKNDSIKVLKYVPINSWSEQEHKKTSGESVPFLQRPSFYDYTDSLLLVYPSPSLNFGDTLRIKGLHRISSVLTDSTLSEIPQKYRMPVLNYATWVAAVARTDPHATTLFQLLNWSLSKIDMTITPGGQVVPATQ